MIIVKCDKCGEQVGWQAMRDNQIVSWNGIVVEGKHVHLCKGCLDDVKKLVNWKEEGNGKSTN